MTRFRFRLEGALRIRRTIAEAETEKLHQLLRDRQKIEKALTAVDEERAEGAAFVQEAEGLGSSDLRVLSSFQLGLEARVRKLSESMNRINKLIDEQQHRVVKAKQAEKAMENLKVKRLAEWTHQVEHEIETAAQELWLCSHTRDKEGSEGLQS